MHHLFQEANYSNFQLCVHLKVLRNHRNRCRSKGLLFKGESTIPVFRWRLRGYLRVFGHPVTQHVQDSVGGCSSDDKLFVSISLVCGKACSQDSHDQSIAALPTHSFVNCAQIFSNITRQLPELFSINIINEAKHKSRLPWEPFDMTVQFEGIFNNVCSSCVKVGSQKCLLITWRTCAGQWHTAVLLLGWRAFVGTSGSNGKGRGSRKGAAVIVQLATGRNHHAVVEGKKGKLCREGNRTLTCDEYSLKFQKGCFYCHKKLA